MSAAMQSTIDRLDKPSAYYMGKVGAISPLDIARLTLYPRLPE